MVESVNVGPAVDVPWGSLKRSAIDKRPAAGPVRVHALGLGGDEIADLKHHGGIDKAVYAFAAEDLEEWSVATGREFVPGQFGENLTTTGIDLNEVRVGERWRIGSAVLEASCVRIPCSVFQGFVDQPQWVRRFTERGRPGAYFRVIAEGEVEAGDGVTVVEERSHDLTIGYLFRAMTTERHLLPGLLEEARISASARKVTKQYMLECGWATVSLNTTNR